MSYGYILIVSIMFVLNGCDRGVGEEPIEVSSIELVNKFDNNLTGTWILSKEFTNKKVIERLDKDIKEYFFKIFPNYNVDYHSFDSAEGFSKPKLYDGKGTWEFFGKNILLKKLHKRTYYLDSEGAYYRDNKNPNMKKPITIHSRISRGSIYEFRITKKNNKLLLWYYDGDYDARRYIMYEKLSE